MDIGWYLQQKINNLSLLDLRCVKVARPVCHFNFVRKFMRSVMGYDVIVEVNKYKRQFWLADEMFTWHVMVVKKQWLISCNIPIIFWAFLLFTFLIIQTFLIKTFFGTESEIIHHRIHLNMINRIRISSFCSYSCLLFHGPLNHFKKYIKISYLLFSFNCSTVKGIYQVFCSFSSIIHCSLRVLKREMQRENRGHYRSGREGTWMFVYLHSRPLDRCLAAVYLAFLNFLSFFFHIHLLKLCINSQFFSIFVLNMKFCLFYFQDKLLILYNKVLWKQVVNYTLNFECMLQKSLQTFKKYICILSKWTLLLV